MIFDNSIIFEEEQVGQAGNKVAPGQHNAILWKLKWRKVPLLWEISFAKKKWNLGPQYSITHIHRFFPKVDCFLMSSHHNSILRKLDLGKVLLLREQRPEALS